MKYIARRVVAIIPTLFIVSVIIFWLMRVLPGDIARNILVGADGQGNPRPEDIEALREQLGLNRPLIVQYVEWIVGMARLDVGNSLWTDRPVFDELFNRLPLTLELGFMASFTSLCIAVPLGIMSAVKRNTWIDYSCRVFAIIGLSIPGFYVGVLLILALVTWFNWIPPLGYVKPWDDPVANFQQVIWAALSLGYVQAALVSRMLRSSLLEVLREDYIRTARSKGIREIDVILKHALRNSLLPVITIVGLGLAQIIGGTVITETVYNLPGVGRFMVDAINHRDYPIVQTMVFIFAVIFATANLLVDLSYTWLDPRIKYE